jgi:DNA-binding FrmR family transcriptional regulator
MCGRIWTEKQYESYVRLEAQKQGKQVALHVGDDIVDLKQQLAAVNQRLYSVVSEVNKSMLKPHVSESSHQKPESSRKVQIVLDVSVLVDVLVGVLLGVVVAHVLK